MCNPCQLLSKTLEYLGLYEPKISIEEALRRLSIEKRTNEQFQGNRCSLWSDFECGNDIKDPIHGMLKKSIDYLNTKYNNKKKVAVDLGCGISSTSLQLLQKGWTVYAVDSSERVLKDLERRISVINKKWVKEGKFVPVHKKIEDFQFPKTAHLIIATESLPYCDPTKVLSVIRKAQGSQGDLMKKI